jgi:hypothetical protein
MPSSDPRVLTETAREIILANPRTVLDIGVGFGKWGVLAREYTDIWNYRFYADEWQTTIIGIEVHGKYDNPIWDIYNKVLLGEALKVVSGIKAGAFDREDLREPNGGIVVPKHYDLAIMIDVLEHFDKSTGQTMLDKVMSISDKFLVGYSNSEQKDVRDNKYEDHLSTWEDKDFDRFTRKLVCGGQGWGVYLLSAKR